MVNITEGLTIKQFDSAPKRNWFVKLIKKNTILTFTIGLLMLNQLSIVTASYYFDNERYSEKFGMNIWLFIVCIPIIYFLQWLFVIWISSKFTKETLKQKFLSHPISTIFLTILYGIDLPYRLSEYGGNIINIFETIVYYAFVLFLWWLLICWISSKIFKKQRFQWHWYLALIERLFNYIPIIYKVVLGIIVAYMISIVLYIVIIFVFNYSGQDLNALFN